MRRILWALLALAVAVVGAGTLALRSAGVQDAIVTRIAQRRIGRDMSGLLAPDALRVLLCGTASPIPSPRRAEACTAVFAGGRMWVVDTGPGSWRTLALRRIRGEAIGAVFCRPTVPRWSPCRSCSMARTRPAYSTRMASS